MSVARYEITESGCTEALKDIMAAKRMNCTDLSAQLGCSRQSVSAILRKSGKDMRVNTLIRLAGSLGFDVLLVPKEKTDEMQSR